jgi:hypothetical protein
MSYFSPYDNVDTRMYISEITLNNYPGSIFFKLYEWKKRGDNVILCNDSILLIDIDTCLLKIIIKCLVYDFDIFVIEPYILNNNERNMFKFTYSMYDDNSGGCNWSTNIHISTDAYLLLTELELILQKYNLPPHFYYIYNNEKCIDVRSGRFDTHEPLYIENYNNAKFQIPIKTLLKYDFSKLQYRICYSYIQIGNKLSIIKKFSLINFIKKINDDTPLIHHKKSYTTTYDMGLKEYFALKNINIDKFLEDYL